MKRRVLLVCAVLLWTGVAVRAQDWPQWGLNSQHTSSVGIQAQPAQHILADIIYDPFVEAEKADPLAATDLLVHYQVPLVDGDNVFMEFKSGQFTDVPHWETQTWNEKRLHWEHGSLVEKWTFQSDWKPVPFGNAITGPFWEPVFHPVLANGAVYIPGAGGSVFKVDKTTGAQLARFTPFGPSIDRDIFVAGALSADSAGNVYYNAVDLAHGQAWSADVVNSWLVKIAANGTVRTATFASLNPAAPKANDKCLGIFHNNQFPWPPSPDAVPPSIPCGSQRPGINTAPAIAADGTIYTVSVAHQTDRTSFLLAVNPDLTPKWAASLRERLHDGCNVQEPPNGTPGGCRIGSTTGVDPSQNLPGSGRVLDDSTSSPTITPDGSILYGAYTRYNYAQGHLMKFSSTGQFLAAYPFGWDLTPSIYVHDGTYSIILKDNRYGETGSYCNSETYCPSDRTANNPANPESYYLTQLDANLVPQWRWQNTNTLSCSRDANGQVSCVSDHPFGFEWCVNAPVVDRDGDVYGNSEDGNLYVIQQGGTLKENLFLQLALGAAYTPVSIGGDGKIYAQNDGHLFVIGR
jgi:hypothetical protein